MEPAVRQYNDLTRKTSDVVGNNLSRAKENKTNHCFQYQTVCKSQLYSNTVQ